MRNYRRPPIAAPVFYDPDGAVIEYGNRWAGAAPPEDTYSLSTHPARFAPLHDIADALIAYLSEVFDVEVAESDAFAADLLHLPGQMRRAVRVIPTDPASAGLTFVYTPYPGVALHAGLLHDFWYPTCGCDACDESWESEAERMEDLVGAVVTGNYQERFEAGSPAWIEYSVTKPEGSASGRSQAGDLPPSRIRQAKETLMQIPEGWAPWPTRAAPSSHLR